MTLRIAGTMRAGELDIDVDLEVPRGHTVALVGPNGAGKTTIIRSITGLQALETGRIEVDGVVWDAPADDIFVPAERRHVGVVFQDVPVVRASLGPGERGVRAASRRRVARPAHEAADSIMARLGVGAAADRRPDSLSGGQAQRVAMGRALAIEPDVLLLDEPMAALDVSARGAVRRDLRDWIASVDGYRLLVTHDPVDAHALADHVVVVEHGRVTQTGTMAELAATRAPTTWPS